MPGISCFTADYSKSSIKSRQMLRLGQAAVSAGVVGARNSCSKITITMARTTKEEAEKLMESNLEDSFKGSRL